MPYKRSKELEEVAESVLEKSANLAGAVLPQTVLAVRKMLRNVNSYYSNLIESRNTTPAEIDKAMRGEMSSDETTRNLQIESKAHILVQEKIEDRIATEKDLNVCSPEFIKYIHHEFYSRLSPESRISTSLKGRRVEVVAGELRKENVFVGKHVPPDHQELNTALARFEEAYTMAHETKINKLIGAAASHHRFVFIHPFLDGNGRVARLLTDAMFYKHKIGGYGLWNISRGLARTANDYKLFLQHADQNRRNDFDGRGNLSEKSLDAFCRYFLKQAVDQIHYMSSRLDLAEFLKNVHYATKDDHPLSYKMIEMVFLKGEVSRKDLFELGDSDRTGRRVMKDTIHKGWLISDTERGHLKINFPFDQQAKLFPRLYES